MTVLGKTVIEGDHKWGNSEVLVTLYFLTITQMDLVVKIHPTKYLMIFAFFCM